MWIWVEVSVLLTFLHSQLCTDLWQNIYFIDIQAAVKFNVALFFFFNSVYKDSTKSRKHDLRYFEKLTTNYFKVRSFNGEMCMYSQIDNCINLYNLILTIKERQLKKIIPTIIISEMINLELLISIKPWALKFNLFRLFCDGFNFWLFLTSSKEEMQGVNSRGINKETSLHIKSWCLFLKFSL